MVYMSSYTGYLDLNCFSKPLTLNPKPKPLTLKHNMSSDTRYLDLQFSLETLNSQPLTIGGGWWRLEWRDLGSRVQDLGVQVSSLKCRVQGLGLGFSWVEEFRI